ncbi:hypothetical protein KAT36_00095 [Candidatus Pacearchaeota archaeon]|nr:hypothetical protein [Candidatus Pacearchaeota archaeon]
MISLPYCGVQIGNSLKIGVPLNKQTNFSLTLPRFYKKAKFDGEHYWEIGMRKYSLKKIKKTMLKYFKIKKVFSPYENKYHVFFVLEKR